MNADHLSYSRAVTVCVSGLAAQLVLSLAVLLYGILSGDAGAVSGALAMLMGLPVWVALGLVFNQHKLERLEALEAEAFASSSAAQATVFEASGDEFVQKNRLAWMHKWFLPAVSIAVGVGFLILGFSRFFADKPKTTLDGFSVPLGGGLAIGVALITAVMSFLFARYVSGMAKQPVWGLLRGGAAVAAGAALVALLIALAHLLERMFDNPALLRILPLVMDVYMIVLGVEVFVNFLLTLYMPRKSGEYVRPAFDSRLLAFLAAPDRLAKSISEAFNYQFGFDVSSTWFYQLVARSIGGLLILGGVIIWGMTCIAVVGPDEKGLLIVNGEMKQTLSSGPVLKAPWPFAKVVRFPAEAVNDLQVGARSPDIGKPILWTNAHSGGGTEFMLLVQPTKNAKAAADGDGAGDQDFELLVAEFPIQFRIADLRRFQLLARDGGADDPDAQRRELLQNEASSVVIEHIAEYSVDQLLGDERGHVAGRLTGLVQDRFDALGPDTDNDGEPDGAGVEVLFVGVNGVHPNNEVAPAFEAAVQADQKREVEIQKAESYRIKTLSEVAGSVERAEQIVAALDELNAARERGADASDVERLAQEVSDLLADAGGEAARLIEQARADRWKAHFDVRAQAIRSQGLNSVYEAAPTVFRMERYTDMMVKVLRGRQIIITSFPSIEINQETQEPYVSISGWNTQNEE